MAVVNPKNTVGRDPKYREHLERIEESGECPFCPERLHAEHPNPIFADNDLWQATDNAYPYEGATNHVLLIPRQHIETVSDMDGNTWLAMKDIVEKVVDQRCIKGAAFLMRFGATSHTGASVHHLHAHVINGVERVDGSKLILALVGFASQEL